MTHSKNILIGMLTTSAIVLAVLLCTLDRKQEAQANMMSHSGSIVLITTGIVSSDDLIHVVDTRQGKMITYGWNNTAKRIQPVAGTLIFK